MCSKAIPIVKLECIGYDREFANDLSLKSMCSNAPQGSTDTPEASGSESSRLQAESDGDKHQPKNNSEGMSTSALESNSADVRRSGRQRVLTSKVLVADPLAGSDSSDYVASEDES